MRFIAYYSRLDQSVMRRVVAPFTVLAERGIGAQFMQIADIASLQTGNYNLIFLPNWAFDGTLPKAQGEYCYDLSDSALLSDERALNVLRQCSHVTVPTETLARLAKPFCNSVHVMPSLVESKWLYSATKPKVERPVVAAIGTIGWDVFLPAFLDMLKEFPEVLVATTNPQLYEQLPEKRRAFVTDDVAFYPRFVRSCYLAIFPGERREIDPAPIREFGLFGIPTIVGTAWSQEVKDTRSGMVASDGDSFRNAFRKLSQDDRARSLMGTAALAAAKEHTAVRCADQWLRSATKFCPISASLSTLR